MPAQTTARPNILVFFTDQQRWDSTGVHGNPLDLPPNFDRIAATGTHIANSFTCQPVCGPARSCLQTGMYATTSGCYTNSRPLPKDAKTLAHFFQEGGYESALSRLPRSRRRTGVTPRKTKRIFLERVLP